MGDITPSRARISAIGKEREVDGSLEDMWELGFCANEPSAAKSGLTLQDDFT